MGFLLPVHDNDVLLQAQPPVYDLFAVSNHFGGLGGGHYTAFCKDAGSDDWSNFDDSHVSPVPTSDSVVSPAAYMLFYRRQSEAAHDSGMASHCEIQKHYQNTIKVHVQALQNIKVPQAAPPFFSISQAFACTRLLCRVFKTQG